jgi:hypothetical protein
LSTFSSLCKWLFFFSRSNQHHHYYLKPRIENRQLLKTMWRVFPFLWSNEWIHKNRPNSSSSPLPTFHLISTTYKGEWVICYKQQGEIQEFVACLLTNKKTKKRSRTRFCFCYDKKRKNEREEEEVKTCNNEEEGGEERRRRRVFSFLRS